SQVGWVGRPSMIGADSAGRRACPCGHHTAGINPAAPHKEHSMRARTLWYLSLVLVFSTAHADQPGKVVHETWDAAFLEGKRAGFYHTTVREIDRNGQKLLQTTLDLDLQVRRYDATARLRAQQGTEETAD